MMKIVPLFAWLLLIAGEAKAQEARETYAIQNVQTGKNLRPYAAGIADGNGIVLYDHWSWKCMTWQFVKVDEDTYQLRNLHTLKTIQPSGTGRGNTTLWQQPLGASKAQQWQFIRDADDTYRIRLKGSDLFITISSEKTNSPIVLMPLQNSTAQQWRLVKQDPWF